MRENRHFSQPLTLQVVFLHKAILAELVMCKNTATKYRKVVFEPTLLAMTLLIITYSVVAYLLVIATQHLRRIWKTALQIIASFIHLILMI